METSFFDRSSPSLSSSDLKLTHVTPSDPHLHLLSLASPLWDLQIQDEGHAQQVNIGLFYVRTSTRTIDFWTSVLDTIILTSADPTWDKGGGVFDQDVVNQLLETETRRVDGNGQTKLSFVGGGGMRVRVLPPEFFWGFHLGYVQVLDFRDGTDEDGRRWLFFEETTMLHMTCADSSVRLIDSCEGRR